MNNKIMCRACARRQEAVEWWQREVDNLFDDHIDREDRSIINGAYRVLGIEPHSRDTIENVPTERIIAAARYIARRRGTVPVDDDDGPITVAERREADRLFPVVDR